MYLNERLVPQAMKLTEKVEQATRFKLYTERYASENYQIMNYGIGGKISGHTDSHGAQNNKVVVDTPGIFLVITNILYLFGMSLFKY